MLVPWVCLVLVGVGSSVAVDVDVNYVADKVIAGLNASLAAHASEWFSLPGFDLAFNNRNESKWSFRYGNLSSIGGIEKSSEPKITYFQEDAPSVIIFVDLGDVVVNYTFGCSDFFVISGYNYSISRSVSTQATIIVDVISDGPGFCQGQVHSTPSSFSYDDDGSDFSRITPDDQYAKQCIVRSYTRVQDYTDRINDRFDDDYAGVVEKMLASATQQALSNLNLCPQ